MAHRHRCSLAQRSRQQPSRQRYHHPRRRSRHSTACRNSGRLQASRTRREGATQMQRVRVRGVACAWNSLPERVPRQGRPTGYMHVLPICTCRAEQQCSFAPRRFKAQVQQPAWDLESPSRLSCHTVEKDPNSSHRTNSTHNTLIETEPDVRRPPPQQPRSGGTRRAPEHDTSGRR